MVNDNIWNMMGRNYDKQDIADFSLGSPPYYCLQLDAHKDACRREVGADSAKLATSDNMLTIGVADTSWIRS